jgi:nucleotide-binding universal stress UspA family protein
MEGTRILVGVDGSTTSQEALRWAIGLGEALGGEVVAIHALGLLDRWRDPDASARSWRRTLCTLVERTWCAPLARSHGRHRVEVRDGDPVDVLLAAVEDEQADLLVVGSRGVGGRPELALGSTSLHVLQAARVPVLVVPGVARRRLRPTRSGSATCSSVSTIPRRRGPRSSWPRTSPPHWADR